MDKSHCRKNNYLLIGLEKGICVLICVMCIQCKQQQQQPNACYSMQQQQAPPFFSPAAPVCVSVCVSFGGGVEELEVCRVKISINAQRDG